MDEQTKIKAQHREAALASLLELSRALVTIHDPTLLLDRAIKLAVNIAPAADRGSLQLLDDEGTTMQTVAISNPDEAMSQTITFRPGVGIAGHALAKNQTINVPDVLEDERFIPGNLQLRFRSLLVAPLVVKGRLLGTISLSSEQISAFSAADETLVQLIADQVAAALENARLFVSHLQAEKLRKAHQFLQSIIDALAARIAILDEQGQIVAINANWRHYAAADQPAGLNHDLGTNYLDACAAITGPYGEEGPGVAAGIRQVMAGQCDQFYLEYPRHRHAEKHWYGVRITRFESDGASRVVVAHEDVTERKIAEEALRASENRFRSLVQNSTDIITLLNADQTVQYVSPPVERILGYTPETLIGQRVFDYVHPEDFPRVQARFDHITHQAGVGGNPLEFRIRQADGSWIWLEAVGNNLLNDPNVKGIVVNARDVTIRKQVEEQLKQLEAQFLQSQKMEAVGRLAGGMAHDFNNLLTIIKGYSDILLLTLDAHSPLKRDAEEIKRAADQAASLTQRLLIFSRRGMTQPQVVDLNSVVVEMEKMLRRLISEDIQMITMLEAELAPIKADPGQMEQVIMNLVINARDAMPQGGRLTIKTANVTVEDSTPLQPVALPPGDYVRLTVTDTGVGMNGQTMEHIFEPFYTTKESGKGTGLGLSTVYAIVIQSNGNIQVDSKPGLGTTFNVYLPKVSDTDHTETGREAETAPPQTGPATETILLVEDEVSVRRLIKQILLKQGYHVLEAQYGNEALKICESHEGPIHLILTDVVMPNSMSGRELAERVKPLLPETRVIYMSGYTDDVIIRHGVSEAGMNFLQKPFNSSTLIQKVREILDAPDQ